VYKSQNLRQNLAGKVWGDLSAGHKIREFFPAAKIRNFRLNRTIHRHLKCHRTTLSTATTARIMLTFRIQYKSSKTTYGEGHWFWTTYGLDFQGMTYT